jgi:hypothetical protein
MSSLNATTEEDFENDSGKLDEEEIFTIYYRQGSNPTCTKNFYSFGPLWKARDRAIAHCLKMGYQFIYIRRLVSDLDFEERRAAR